MCRRSRQWWRSPERPTALGQYLNLLGRRAYRPKFVPARSTRSTSSTKAWRGCCLFFAMHLQLSHRRSTSRIRFLECSFPARWNPVPPLRCTRHQVSRLSLKSEPLRFRSIHTEARNLRLEAKRSAPQDSWSYMNLEMKVSLRRATARTAWSTVKPRASPTASRSKASSTTHRTMANGTCQATKPLTTSGTETAFET